MQRDYPETQQDSYHPDDPDLKGTNHFDPQPQNKRREIGDYLRTRPLFENANERIVEQQIDEVESIEERYDKFYTR